MRVLTVVATTVAAVAIVSGCASPGRVATPPITRAPGTGRAVAPVESGATVAGNRRLARAETRRLVGLAVLPAQRTRLPSAPRGLHGPAMGTPAVTSLLDTAQYYRVRMSFVAAQHWLNTRDPAGLKQSGTGSTSKDGTLTSYGAGWTDRGNVAYESPELDVEVAPASTGTSYWRVDGMAVWVDPTPARDEVHGRTIHPTPSGGCPATDRGVHDVRNAGADLDHELVPNSRPTAVLACEFDGANGQPFRLVAHVIARGDAAARLQTTVRAISLSHSVGGVISCPMDDGRAIVLSLAYPGGRTVDLWYLDSGCQFVLNGHISAGPGGLYNPVHRLLH